MSIQVDKRPSTHCARPHSLNDTRLFAALVTLGIKPVEGPTIFCGETPDGTPRQTWFLERQSMCGKYNTAEMIAAWHSQAWMDAHPEHPLAYLRAFSANMNICIDHVKNTAHTMHVIRGRGGKLGMVAPNDPRSSTDAILRVLKR